MARRVLLHIGLPKTATSYLQTIIWSSREQLRADGLLVPGRERRDHLWASRIVRESPVVQGSPERERTAWDRLRADVEAWPGDALISHEFFAAASAEQAHEMVAALAPAQVHLVVTAREPLGLFTASWQESLKNRETTPMADYAAVESDHSSAVWNWRTLDLRLVLQRWGGVVPPGRVHILPLGGPDQPREEIWHRFAGVLGLDGSAYDLSGSFPNESMGVAEAETLRRINAHLDSFETPFDRGVYIRTILADERLVPRRGERFWPEPEQIEECRRRGEDAIAFIEERGFDVVGDVERLRVPLELPDRRTPASVSDAEVAEVAVALSATMLSDVRELRNEVKALRRRLRQQERAASRPLVRRLVARLRSSLSPGRRPGVRG